MDRVLTAMMMVALIVSVTQAETMVPGGNVSGTWDAAGSPYLIQGDIAISGEDTLTIMPGTTVNFQSDYAMTVSGRLNAAGTQGDSVLFTGTAYPGWHGIRFIDAISGSNLEYCAITNGRNAETGAPYDRGGAIYCENSSPVINNCRISGNSAFDYGGAIYCYQSAAIISNCLISDNQVGDAPFATGGGIYCSYSQTQIIGNMIVNNVALGPTGDSEPPAYGGGIGLSHSSDTVAYNLVASNRAESYTYYPNGVAGGGMYVTYGGPQIVNNTIVENSATNNAYPNFGGGIMLNPGTSDALIMNNIVNRNIGDGIYFDAVSQNTTVLYNDISENGQDLEGSLDGIPSGLGVITTTNANGDSCDVFYNIYSDPLFVDFNGGDYHLTGSSPCIDAGDPTSPHDPDGTVADMGAYYYNQSATTPQAIQDLTILRAGNDVTLRWSRITTDTQGNPITVSRYVIYAAAEPLEISEGDSIGYVTPPDTVFVHTNAVDNDKGYYTVRSVGEQ
jgi:predicted outer membrane repeat protein